MGSLMRPWAQTTKDRRCIAPIFHNPSFMVLCRSWFFAFPVSSWGNTIWPQRAQVSVERSTLPDCGRRRPRETWHCCQMLRNPCSDFASSLMYGMMNHDESMCWESRIKSLQWQWKSLIQVNTSIYWDIWYMYIYRGFPVTCFNFFKLFVICRAQGHCWPKDRSVTHASSNTTSWKVHEAKEPRNWGQNLLTSFNRGNLSS